MFFSKHKKKSYTENKEQESHTWLKRPWLGTQAGSLSGFSRWFLLSVFSLWFDGIVFIYSLDRATQLILYSLLWLIFPVPEFCLSSWPDLPFLSFPCTCYIIITCTFVCMYMCGCNCMCLIHYRLKYHMIKNMQGSFFFLRFVWPHLIYILMLFSRILTLSWFLFVCVCVCYKKPKKYFIVKI